MRALALMAMRSKWQAIFLVVLLGCFPIFSWLNIALTGFIVLRKGFAGTKILPWSALPYLVWLWIDVNNLNYIVIIVALVTTVVSASILRTSMSWEYSLVAAVVVNVLILLCCKLVLPTNNHLYQQFDTIIEYAFKIIDQQTTIKNIGFTSKDILRSMMITSLEVFILLLSSVCLLLARSCQAAIYNQGAFTKEFYNIRINKFIAILLLLSLLAITLSKFFIILFCMLCVPFFIAGISLVHNLCSMTKYKRILLLLFYSCTIFLIQIIPVLVIIVACIDSIFDFRHKLYQKKSNHI